MARILHIVGDSKYGGASVLIERLAAEALRHGHDVSVLTTDTVFQQRLKQIGVGIVSLNCIWRPIRPIRDIRGLICLWRYLRKEKWDIVHTHTSKGGFVGRIAARLAQIPVVIHTVHGFAFHEKSTPIEIFFYSALEWIAAWFCDALVTVSYFHRDWAARLHIGSESKRIAIPNGIDPKRIKAIHDCDSVRTSLGIETGCIMCLIIGRLARQKGLDILLHALTLIPHHEKIKIVIAGEGEERNILEQAARKLNVESRVLFLGFRTDLGDLLAASDIVVLPSLREGLSISLLEAMAAGKAIITTDIGSNLEVTKQGKAAFIVKAGSISQLADAILKLAHNKEMRDKLGQSALSVFENEYREDIMLHRYMNLYAHLLRNI